MTTISTALTTDVTWKPEVNAARAAVGSGSPIDSGSGWAAKRGEGADLQPSGPRGCDGGPIDTSAVATCESPEDGRRTAATRERRSCYRHR
jgi:hypothetical protein